MQNIYVPKGLGSELMEQVRKNTRLSHSMSRVAVGTIVSHLKERLPALETVMDDIMQDLLNTKVFCAIVETAYH